VCHSLSLSCVECNIKSDCGWCGSGSCILQHLSNTCSQWTPDVSQCPTSSNETHTVKQTFAFRLSEMSLENFGPVLQGQFVSALASLFRGGIDSSNIRILALRAGSVIIDVEVTSSNAVVAAAVCAILVNPDTLQRIPTFGPQLSSIVLPADSVCTVASSSSSCSSSAGCGWYVLLSHLPAAPCVSSLSSGAACLPAASLARHPARRPPLHVLETTGRGTTKFAPQRSVHHCRSFWKESSHVCVQLLGRCGAVWQLVVVALAVLLLHLLHFAAFLRCSRGLAQKREKRCIAAVPGIGVFAW
jgi:hypothetical protein